MPDVSALEHIHYLSAPVDVRGIAQYALTIAPPCTYNVRKIYHLTALAQERQQGTTILFPIRMDNTVMTLKTGWPTLMRHTRTMGAFRCWKTHGVYQQAFVRLLRDLRAAEGQPGGSRPVG